MGRIYLIIKTRIARFFWSLAAGLAYNCDVLLNFLEYFYSCFWRKPRRRWKQECLEQKI